MALRLNRRGVAVFEVVDLNHIVRDYLSSPEYEKLHQFHPGVIMITELAPDLIGVKGSSVHLFKTLMNLVSNAAEAMPEGGTICIQTLNRYVDHSTHTYETVVDGEYAVLSVVDEGIGIPDGDMARVFEPFYTKKVMGKSGTGLGMAVVWGTVKDHYGFIDTCSHQDQGTTFTLYFPATDERSKPVPDQWSPADFQGQGETILVIDDVAEQREIATAMLARLGYQVQAVAGGEAAVDYLKERPVDLLVLDMIMEPGIDGLETYRRILGIHPNQKAIIVSGYANTVRIDNTLKLGAADFLKKPYRFEHLARAVWAILHW